MDVEAKPIPDERPLTAAEYQLARSMPRPPNNNGVHASPRSEFRMVSYISLTLQSGASGGLSFFAEIGPPCLLCGWLV